jgi:lysozyme family protein
MREVPEYIRQLQMGSMPMVEYSGSMAAAKQTGQISDQLDQLAEEQHKKSVEIEKLKTISTLKTRLSELSAEFSTDPAGLKNAADGYRKGFIKEIKSPELAAEFDARYEIDIEPYIAKATAQRNKLLDEDHKYQIYNNVDTNLTKVKKISALLLSDIPEHRQAAAKSLQLSLADLESSLNAKGADEMPLISAERRFSIMQSAKQEALKEAATSYIVNARNPIDALVSWQNGDVTFSLPNDGAPVIAKADEAINYIIDNFEGEALVKDDGGKGASKFGINQTANPEVDVKNLTREQAAQIYKTKYWDAIKADSLPENMRLIALDTAINFGQGTALEMIKQAEGSPEKLAELRAQKHQKLIESDPNKYGKYAKSWARRDKYFADQAAGEMGVNIREQMDAADVARIDKTAAEIAGKFVMQQKVEAAVAGIAVLDPKNKEDKDAVDAHYQQTIAEFQRSNTTGQSIDQYAMTLVQSYGMVPQTLQKQIRAGLRSSNTDNVIAQTNMLQYLRSQNPLLLDDFANEDIRISNTITSLVDSGYTPQEAVIKTKEQMITSPDLIEQRKKEFKEAQVDFKAIIENQYNRTLLPDPDIPNTMKLDAERLAALEYELTGDIESAKTTAVDNLLRVWSKTNVGSGSGWVKNPPEKYYSAPININNAEWMNKQLKEDFGIDADELLVVDSNRKLNGRPTYYVFKRENNGLLQRVTNKEWIPDWERTPENQEQIQNKANEIINARQDVSDLQRQKIDSMIRNANRYAPN